MSNIGLKPCLISLTQRLYFNDVLRMFPNGYSAINTNSATEEQNFGINFNGYRVGNIKSHNFKKIGHSNYEVILICV